MGLVGCGTLGLGHGLIVPSDKLNAALPGAGIMALVTNGDPVEYAFVRRGLAATTDGSAMTKPAHDPNPR